LSVFIEENKQGGDDSWTRQFILNPDTEPVVLQHPDTEHVVLQYPDTEPVVLQYPDTEPVVLQHPDTEHVVLQYPDIDPGNLDLFVGVESVLKND